MKWSLERRKISPLYAAVILVPDSILLQEVKNKGNGEKVIIINTASVPEIKRKKYNKNVNIKRWYILRLGNFRFNQRVAGP